MNDLPATLDQLPVTLDQLVDRLQTLERRVYVLEHPAATPSAATAAANAPYPVQVSDQGVSVNDAGRFFPVAGRALLGVAGAYVLRAVSESTSLPKMAVAAIAIAYALLWLFWAARTRSASWLTSAVYAGTSAVILAPMLWELTLKFNVLQPATAASVLAIFVVAASALSWKRDLASVVWVANGTAAVAALALAAATHQFLPFITVLLLMALICEVAAEFKHELTVRPFVAAAADIALWALIFVYAGPQLSRADYPPLGTAALLVSACTLFLIYAASVALRSAVLGQQMTLFETIQAMMGFLLAAVSVGYFAPRFGLAGIGEVCLCLSAVCFVLVVRVVRGTGAGRNYQVFTGWATSLLFVGSLLALSPVWQAMCMGGAAVAVTLLGVRLNRLTLQIHATLLLLSAAIACGMLAYAFQCLAGSLPAHLTPAVAIVTICTMACYAVGKSADPPTLMRQVLRHIPAALAVCALAAVLVQAVLWLAALRIALDAYHVAFVRTLAVSALALALAYAGSRFNRMELTRIAYAVLAFIAAKLVFEDLRLGHFEFIAASIFLFAIALISVPHLARRTQKR